MSRSAPERPRPHVRFALAAPAREPAHLIMVLRERLARVALPAPVVAITLASEATAPLAGRNLGLLPGDEALATVPLLDRLRARLGDDAVTRVVAARRASPRARVEAQEADAARAPPGKLRQRRKSQPLPIRAPPPAPRKPAPMPDAPRPAWLLAEPEPLGHHLEARPWVLRDGPERIESGWWDGADVRRDDNNVVVEVEQHHALLGANTSTALLQKPTIREAVSGYLVDQLYANVDVPGKLRSGLPSELRPLAGPVSGALHGVAESAAERVLAIPRVQNLWRTANRTADEELVRIINGGNRQIQIEHGTVLLNLHQIVADLSRRLGLDAGLVEQLPPSFAQVKVVSSNNLGVVRTLAKGLHALAIVLSVLVCVLYAVALLLAGGARRRRTLMQVGLSLVFAGLAVLAARAVARGQIVSAITKDASIEPAARDTYSVATSLLVQVATSAIVIGLPAIFAAWLAGPSRVARGLRRFAAPRLRERPLLAYWITGAVLAVVFLWGPVRATRQPFGMLLFTILALIGAHVLGRQIAAEFPDAEPVSLRALARRNAAALGEQAARIPGAMLGLAGGGRPSRAEEIERLLALREQGALSEAEFDAAKRDVLAGR